MIESRFALARTAIVVAGKEENRRFSGQVQARESCGVGATDMLSERVAVVTGGSRGIGLAVGHVLGANGDFGRSCGCGAQEAQDAASDLSKLGGRAVGIACDVTSEAEVERMVAEVISSFGTIDMLVNNRMQESTATPPCRR